MSLEYVERKVKEALKLAKGNKLRARRQIIAWTYEDVRLLQALTSHHLTGIVAYHIERVDAVRAAAKPQKSSSGPKGKVPKEEKFGLELLKALAGPGAARFGLEGPGVTARRGKASPAHEDAIRKLAVKADAPGKSKKKK
jgi:hypothetical protein